MNFEDIIAMFSTNPSLSDEQVNNVLNDNGVRRNSVKYLRQYPNREFAKALLGKVLAKRKAQDYETGSIEDVMFSCYLLALHHNVEDSLTIWRAKNIDFDSYCGLDIQLVVFAGVNETLNYLRTLKTEESNKAIDYLKRCIDAGDFIDLEEYYSETHQPWWI